MLAALSKALDTFTEGDGQDVRSEALANLAATFQALDAWAHGAHLLAKGVGFVGDHAELLGPLYQRAGEAFDSVSERALGLGAPDASCEPAIVARAALAIMGNWPTVAGSDESDLMRSVRDVVGSVLTSLNVTTKQITDLGAMTRGLDNLLAQLSDDFEGFAYKLGRRST